MVHRSFCNRLLIPISFLKKNFGHLQNVLEVFIFNVFNFNITHAYIYRFKIYKSKDQVCRFQSIKYVDYIELHCSLIYGSRFLYIFYLIYFF